MKKWIALYTLSGIVMILFNLFPRYDIKKMDHESRGDVLININTPLNEPYFENYDRKLLEQGNTIVAYENGNLYCYRVNEVCDSAYDNASSQITLYDQNMEVIWNIGGNLMNDTDILFQNHHINVRAIDQLKDGSFVAFGRSVELTTEILYDVLLFIDPLGVMSEMKIMDLTSYGYVNLGGHLYYDVIATDDGGFTLKFTDLFRGTVLIHMDSDAEETWFVRMNDVEPNTVYFGIHNSSYLETLQYVDGLAIVLVNDTVYAYNDQGLLIWSVDVDSMITGFSVDSTGDVIITYMMNDEVIQPKNLLMIDNRTLRITSIVTQKLKSQSGQSEWISSYDAKQESDVSYYSLHAWQDEDHDYYNLLYPYSYSRVLEYPLFLFKYTEKGEFIASLVIQGRYATWNDVDTIMDIDFKKDVMIEGEIIHLITPTLTNNSVYDINVEHIQDKMPITFSLIHYEIVIQLRTMFNRMFCLVTIIIMGFLGWYSLKTYQKNHPHLDDI